MAQSNGLTQATHDRLSAELEDLTSRGRNEIATALEAARDEVDTDAGGDFHAAKDAQSQLEARIEFLTHTLDKATIVEAPQDGCVGIGSLVEVRFPGSTDTETYLFGSIEERHGDTVDVSPSSPLGVALGGAKGGDTVSFTNPAGDDVSVDVVTVH